jgi:hypothetical protein
VNTTSKSRSHTSDFFIIKTSFWSFKGLSRAALSELKSMVLLKQPSSPRCQPSFLATKKIYFSCNNALAQMSMSAWCLTRSWYLVEALQVDLQCSMEELD